LGRNEQGNYFQFELAVLRATPSMNDMASVGGTGVTMQQEYQKFYRYRRTRESLDAFVVDEFAELLVRDLQADPVAQKIR
jgi:hypothetical protein